MRQSLLLVVVMLMVGPCLAQEEADQEGGTIAVRCPPGCEVFLDGKLVGTTTEEEKGKKLEGVAPGKHDVRLVKPGHEPKTASVMVGAGATVELSSGPFKPLAAPKPARKGFIRVMPPPAGARASQPEAITGREPADSTASGAQPGVSGSADVAGEPPSSAAENPQGAGGAILFMRARGASSTAGRSVHIWSLHGPDEPPQEVFACREGDRCTVRYEERLAPGLYRFRVGFRHVEGVSPDTKTVFSTDIDVDLEAAAGRYYVIDADYGGDSAEQCTAKVVAPGPGER